MSVFYLYILSTNSFICIC